MKRVLIVLAAFVTASAASAAPFTNGSFETAPSIFGGFTQLNAPSALIPSWSVTAGSVDWISTYWNPSAGASSVDLNGISAGTLTQTFDTTPGQLYQVTFDMAGNPDGGLGTRQLSVSTDGVTFTPFSFTVGVGDTLANMGWEQRAYSFTASAPVTTLTFRSDAAANSAFGPALDNVSVTAAPIPEPATLAVFGGLAFAGGLGYRRRKATATA